MTAADDALGAAGVARVPPLTWWQNLSTLPPAVPQQVFQALLLAKMRMEQQPDQPGVRIDEQLYESVTRCADLCHYSFAHPRDEPCMHTPQWSVPIVPFASEWHLCALYIPKLTGRSHNAWCLEPARV